MANKKISQLTAIVTVDTAADLFPIVDTSAIETKSITPSALKTALSLNNVDNTTDANKPVSTATQTALNAKQDTLVSATNIKTINSTSILGSGNIVVGATPSGIAGAIQFSDGSAFSSDATNFFWDDTNNRLGIGTNAPTEKITAKTTSAADGISLRDASNQLALIGKWFDSGGFLDLSLNGTPYTRIQASQSYINTPITFGSTSALSAMVGIKGSGSTSATTSLLVQNSAGTQLMNMTDDGHMTIGNSGSNSGALLFQYPTTIATNGVFWGDSYATLYGAITLSRGTGEMRFATYAGGYFPTFYSNAVEAMRIDISQNVGIGTTTPTARLHIKGSGATSATTSLLVQNSAGTAALTVKDDLTSTFGGTTTTSGDINFVGNLIRTARGRINFYGTDGEITLTNSSESGFGLLKLGGLTSSFPALKRASNNIEIRNADDTFGAGFSVGGALNASAILQADSTTKGFLPPRMTTTQRNAISSPAAGLMIYNTTTAKLNVYTTAWEEITSL